MPAREPLSPWSALGFAVLLFGVAALMAWMTLLRYQGPRIEREARFMGCDRLAGGLWQLQFYPGPTAVRLEASGEHNAEVARLCARQAQVRVVARAKGNMGEPITWVEGLEDLESGEVVISEEDAIQSRRNNRVGGVIMVTFFAGLGLLACVTAVRDFLKPSARPTTRGATHPVPVSPSLPSVPSSRRKSGSLPVRKTELGPSYFVKRHPLSARILIPLAGAGILAGGVSYLREFQGTPGAGLGYWTYNFPLGLVLTAVGVLLLWLGWGMIRTRTEVFRDGLVHNTWRDEVIIHFRDLKAFSYGEYQEAGINIWSMGFVDEDGRQVGVRVQPDVFREKELPKLRDALAEMLAERMAAQLDYSGVPWMPGVEILRDGLYFPGSEEPPMKFSGPLVLHCRNGMCHLQRGTFTHEWRMDSLNFYPGLLLIQRLTQAAQERRPHIQVTPRWWVE